MFEGISSDQYKISVFTESQSIYIVPLGTRLLYYILCGGGGGGGGGRSGAAGTNRGGGGGGSSPVMVSGFFLGQLLPDTLMIRVGRGGSGGTANGNGAPGGGTEILLPSSFVFTGDINNPAHFLPCVFTQGALGGAAGGTTGSSAGGVVSLDVNHNYSFMSTYAQMINGRSGDAGGIATGGNGLNSSFGGGTEVSAGAGGAGIGTNNVQFSGGWTSTSLRPNNVGGSAGGGAGNDGVTTLPLDPMNLMVREGGSGGGSNASGVGGRGGNGGLGAGGGGGGGGITGGAGGNGGNGFAVLVAIF